MAGAAPAFQSAVRALWWCTVLLGGAALAIPADLAPPGQKEAASLGAPSTCSPLVHPYRSSAIVRFVLTLGLFAAALLTSGIQAAAAGVGEATLLPKDGGASTASSAVPLHLRVLFLLAVALTAASAVLAGVACVQAIGVVFRCLSVGVQATVVASSAIGGASFLYTLGSIAVGGFRASE